MNSFYNVLFMLQFFAFLAILGAKVYNLMQAGAWYDIKAGFLLFAGSILAWGLGMIVLLVDSGDEILFSVLLRIESAALTLMVLFMVAELFFFMGNKAQEIIKPHNARALSELDGGPHRGAR